MPPLRVASFGAGWVTTHRHIAAMRAVDGFEVAALVDRDADRARTEAARLEIPRWAAASNVHELDFADEIDAITCGTAPFGHYEVVKSAIEAGKHVITEKPFMMNVAEGEEVVALAAERGVVLAVVHNFQFASSALKLRRWIDSGRLGTVRAVWAIQLSNPKRRLPTWYDELPLGLFYDEGPHLLYLARALAGGDAVPVSALAHPSTTGRKNTPAQLDVQLRASSGAPVTLQMNFEAPLSEWQVAVMGDKGMGVVDVFRDIALFTPNDGDHFAKDVLRTTLSATAGHLGGYVKSGVGHVRGTLLYGNETVFSRFRDAALSGTAPEGISGEDALAVLKLQHWIAETAATGAAPAPAAPAS
jgi:predicted dehydrogenase